jgi:hypothetical protein
MKYYSIIDNKKSLIDFCRINSKRFELLKQITVSNISPPNDVENLVIDRVALEKIIENLLITREKNWKDVIIDHGDRFSLEQIFIEKQYKGAVLKLYTSGYDNTIIFLLNILDAIYSNTILSLKYSQK